MAMSEAVRPREELILSLNLQEGEARDLWPAGLFEPRDTLEDQD